MLVSRFPDPVKGRIFPCLQQWCSLQFFCRIVWYSILLPAIQAASVYEKSLKVAFCLSNTSENQAGNAAALCNL